MNQSAPSEKRAYAKPEVKVIKLAAEEVLTEGCKTINPGTGYRDPLACAPISSCDAAGS